MFLGSFLISCEEINEDSPIEISCRQAAGLWTMIAVTCDGGAIDVTPSTFTFDPDSNVVTQRLGRVDCTKTYNWLVEMGDQTPLFSMTGQGTILCTQSGQEVNSCASEVNSCNSGIDFTGIKNEYPTCVITSKGLTLTRTVSGVNNPDGLSLCESGQEEEVTLVQGEYTPPTPEPEPEPGSGIAFLTIEGPNPLDFGTHAIGSRRVQIISVTNTGEQAASQISGTGLAAPFYFLGGTFPGTGGSCGLNPLEVSATCEIVVEFFPSVAQYFTDSLILTYSNGSGSANLIQGLAATASNDLAQLVINEGPYFEYSTLNIGQTQSHIFTVSNIGGGGASSLAAGVGLMAPFEFTGGLFPGLGGTCGATLATGEQCTIDISFSPSSQGSFNDSIEVDYSDGLNLKTATRNVFGQGVP